MSTPSQPALPDRVYAEAIVRSRTGASLLDTDTPITSDNVDRFLATADAVQAAAQQLRSAGFEIVDIGSVSITVAAPPEVYEQTLATQLEAIERPVIKELGQTTTATFINATDDKPFGEIDVAGTQFSRLLDGIAISEPIYYFAHPHPLPAPPNTSADYLSVPEGVVEGLNASSAHQQGVTGKGVKVVMVDSGWYAHPFFRERNYKVKVVLAPGSTDSTSDPLGHGTGESANLLAIAPDIDLTVVKADAALSGTVKNVNSISALRTAIELRPDIISCSWGSDQRRQVLSPYNRVMGAVIADAVRRGITVVFSAGNGQYGFPAQHPDAIAAGGVYRYISGSLKDTLEASNYASSFVSPMYPGRAVPDVCGLVGKLPYGSYLMLPVPPGSDIDQRLAIFKDGTERTDGWAAFSGTSAAAPQLAGVYALLKQANPNLNPAQVKRVLQQTARDVNSGFSNPSSSGAAARDGPDLATGYGLADAATAIQSAISVSSICKRTKSSDSKSYFEAVDSHSNIQFHANSKGAPVMSFQNTELRKNFEKILWEFEEVLAKYNIDDLELEISESNFISRSLKSKTTNSLRKSLNKCFPLSENTVIKTHILTAQSLLKLGKYQETALEILIEVITNSKYESLAEVRELALQSLGEFSDSDNMTPSTEVDFFDCGGCIDGKRTCTNRITRQSITYDC